MRMEPCEDEFEFVDEITVKGKSEKVKVYTINNSR